MAKVDTKELAQCLAFAYFAEHPTYDKPQGNKDSEHAIGFYTLFSGKENVSNYKKKYLSNQFPIDLVKREFAVTKTATGKQSYHTTAKKVYNVARACVESKMFKYPLNQYEFLDQDDPFTQQIKDEPLKLIKQAFGFPQTVKFDILSAVDVFLVKSSEKRRIAADFKAHFSNKDEILRNGIWGKSGVNDYASIMGKYMREGVLIPISLKLPNNVTGKPHIKLIDIDKNNTTGEEIDPFMKMLAAILNEPNKTKKIIETVIDIDFNKFVLHENLNWVFPVNFNYKDLKDPKTGEPISKYNLRFNLFAQGYGAGWNGQFDVSTKAFKDTQWVGGVSIPTFEKIADSYSEYSRSINKVMNLRVEVFDKFCSKLKESNSKAFEEAESHKAGALAEIKKPKIVYGMLLKKTKEFFDTYDAYAGNKGIKDIPSFTQYQNEFINEVRKFDKKYTGEKKQRSERIGAHFSHAQISYFLLEGGTSFQLYFKQKLFVTIFGLITKMAHKVFDLDDYPGMRSAITQAVQNQAGKELMHEFKTAPHYIVS